MDILKISTKSNPNSVAGAIAGLIKEKGTGYITDIGMTGAKKSVIGMNIDASIKRFVTTLPERYKSADGEAKLNGCIFEINDENCRTININRIIL